MYLQVLFGVIVALVVGVTTDVTAGHISDHSSEKSSKSSEKSSGGFGNAMGGTGHATAFGLGRDGDSGTTTSGQKSNGKSAQQGSAQRRKSGKSNTDHLGFNLPPTQIGDPDWNDLGTAPSSNETFIPPGIVLIGPVLGHVDLPENANVPTFLEPATNVEPVQNPEPSTVVMFGLGALALAGARRCRSRSHH